MDSDSSSYYETTFSEDERIGIALREAKEISERQKARNDLMRKIQYDRYLETRNLDIFNLPGLEFHTFRHLKIKFSFYPRAITRYVNEKVRFYISLKYWFKYWLVKRDSLPANYKWRIYSLFYSENNFAVSDDNIISVIVKIYKILINWCKEQEEFRLDKYERYRRKECEDVDLDSDDEELFLDEAEKIVLYNIRLKILHRMIPPQLRH